ncbi:MAG TPA: tripartite tricarboxylate transporter substrate binding protein [Burkholderiales bacterium]|nr:tripartite tricarboxylate transporter substrate binding protein [Burkholderiales bacterium]
MKRTMHTHAVTGAIMSIAVACGAGTAHAQAYPAKPIELTIPNSPGSGGDLVSRTVVEIIRRDKLLPQPFILVNRAGGASVPAYTYFQTRRGDPYYMLSITGTILAMAYRPDTNIPLKNYTPVALMAVDPQTIMVPYDSPYKTFKELVEAARKTPDSLVAATTSVQGTGRLVVHLIEKHVPGAKFKFVTFKGGGDAVTSTAGGHTHFTTENLSEALSFVQAKKLRVLAVSADRRLPQAPDVPTLQELGYPITAGTMRGFAFTAGVPKEAVSTMESALQKVHNSSAWKELAQRSIFQDVFLGSAEFTKFLEMKMEEYRVFYDAIGLGKSKS